MKILFPILFLSLSNIPVAAADYTRFCPPDEGSTIVSIPATTETATIKAPDWIEAEVTNGEEVETGKSVTVIILRHQATSTYRTALVTITFPTQTITVHVTQAGKLDVTTTADDSSKTLSGKIPFPQIRKIWFVPDDGSVIPDPAYQPTREGFCLRSPETAGYLYVATVTEVFATRIH